MTRLHGQHRDPVVADRPHRTTSQPTGDQSVAATTRRPVTWPFKPVDRISQTAALIFFVAADSVASAGRRRGVGLAVVGAIVTQSDKPRGRAPLCTTRTARMWWKSFDAFGADLRGASDARPQQGARLGQRNISTRTPGAWAATRLRLGRRSRDRGRLPPAREGPGTAGAGRSDQHRPRSARRATPPATVTAALSAPSQKAAGPQRSEDTCRWPSKARPLT